MSTARQADRGNSLEAQKERIERYAKALEYEIVGYEIDAGASAGSLERPGLKRALDRLDRFEANAIVVTKLDRLSRSLRDMTGLVEAYFKDGDNFLISLNESIDTTTANGRMVLSILTCLAEWEREVAAERTQEVMQHMRETGRFTGGWPPFGWSVDEEGALVPNDAETDIIGKARELRGAGHPLRAIAGAIGVNPRTGNDFDAKAVARMLADAHEIAQVVV